jgi:type I restriction enzyme S subunit
MTGSAGQKRVPVAYLKQATVPRLDPSEQRRIADILDKADAIRRKRKEAIALTEDLLRSAFLDIFGDPVTNPKGWKTGKMSDLCLRITDGTHLTPKFDRTGVPFLFVRNVEDGRLRFATDKYISRATYEELTRRCPIEVGDVLYVTVGATYGDAVVVETDAPFSFQRHLAHLKPDPQITRSTFLHSLLRSPFIKSQADRRVRGAAQPTLNLGELRDFDVILPPLKEQLVFEEVSRVVHRMRAPAESAHATASDFFESLLRRVVFA